MSKNADANADMFRRLEALMLPEKYRMLRARLFPSLHDLECQKLLNDKMNTIWKCELAELIVMKAIHKNIKDYERETFELREKERAYYANRIFLLFLLNQFEEEQTLKHKILYQQYLMLVAKINLNLSNCLKYIFERINYMDKLIDRVDNLIYKVEESIDENRIEFENTYLQVIDNLHDIANSKKIFLQSLIADYTNNTISLEEFHEEFIKQITDTDLAENEIIDALLKKLKFHKQDIQEKVSIHNELKNIRNDIIEHKQDLLNFYYTVFDNKADFNNSINSIALSRDTSSYNQIANLFQNQPNANIHIINEELYSNRSNINSQNIYDKMASIETRIFKNIYKHSPAEYKPEISLNNRK